MFAKLQRIKVTLLKKEPISIILHKGSNGIVSLGNSDYRILQAVGPK